MTTIFTKPEVWYLLECTLGPRRVDVTHLLGDSKFTDSVFSVASKIYANDHRGRDFLTVYNSTLRGELGEQGIFELLRSQNVEVEHNSEAHSGEHHWDLKVEGYKVEVKFQAAQPGKQFFAFNDPAKDETLRQLWGSISFVIAFWLDVDQETQRVYVIPWLLIDAKAFSSERGLYVRSSQNAGYYLKMDKARQENLTSTLGPSPGEGKSVHLPTVVI